MDLVAAARDVADALLRPAAEATDTSGVPRAHLDALAAAGLFGLVVPSAYGGADATPTVQGGVTEELAAADANTWFVWTQHHTPVRTIVRGDNEALKTTMLPAMARGEVIAGTAFTHLRRPDPPAVVATPDGPGWRFTGSVAWMTSWGLADRFLVAAQHEQSVVWGLLTLAEGESVVVHRLPLAAMSATSTVRLELRNLPVAATDVALVEPLAGWQVLDAQRTAGVNPAVFGVAREALDRLRSDAALRGDDDASTAADMLRDALARLRERALRLAEQPPEQLIDERIATRADALAFGVRATAAFLTYRGGRGITFSDPAQRLVRAALFLLVQGQTEASRIATLEALARLP